MTGDTSNIPRKHSIDCVMAFHQKLCCPDCDHAVGSSSLVTTDVGVEVICGACGSLIVSIEVEIRAKE
jgi:transcription elongation factor Elf1